MQTDQIGVQIRANVGVDDAADPIKAQWVMAHALAGRAVFSTRVKSSRVTSLWGCRRLIDDVISPTGVPRPSAIDYTTYWSAWGEAWFLTVSKDYAVLMHVESSAPDLMAVAGWMAELPPPDGPYVRWLYQTETGISSSEMPISGRQPVDSFYPWASEAGGLGALWADYLASDANVLLLIGPPGTGKTSFLRGLLHSRPGLEAWVTYDPAVQRNESLYTSFANPGDSVAMATEPGGRGLRPARSQLDRAIQRALRDSDGESDSTRILVLEDSDHMLASRDRGNELMARILNLSDGLVSVPRRKVVFSTNLPSLSSVDPALLRPGRCFAALNFRALTAGEARMAASAVGRPLEGIVDGRQYTLAQALNSGRAAVGGAAAVRKIGFC